MVKAGQEVKANKRQETGDKQTSWKVIVRVVGRGRNLSKLIPREEILTWALLLL